MQTSGLQYFEHKTDQTEQAGKGRVAGTECEQGKGTDGLGWIQWLGCLDAEHCKSGREPGVDSKWTRKPLASCKEA